jgi:hypothetical protein
MDDKGAGNRSSGPAMGEETAKTPGDASQFGLGLGPDDPAAVRLEAADRADRRQRRDGLRSDARRTVEYIASRGRTPIEAMHDIVKLGWKDGTRQLAKELGINRAEAFKLWLGVAEATLPYTAPRLDGLDLGAALGAVAGGAGLAHYLAASALGAELARDRAAVPGVAVRVSHEVNTLDATELPGLAGPIDRQEVSDHDTLSRLPPRGSD